MPWRKGYDSARDESHGRARSLLEPSFASEEVREICEKRAIASEAIGALASLALMRVLADVAAAENLTELQAIIGERLIQLDDQEFAVSLGGGSFFRFRAGRARPPEIAAGSINWDKVDRIKIVAFGKNDE
jgi:hypothetical protein